MAGREDRVREGRRSLHCGVCGAGNPLSADALEHGWFRCSHCASPAPIPGVGDFAVEGPARRAFRVVRPGSSELETVDELIVPFGWALIGFAAADLALGAALYLTGRVDPLLAEAATPILTGLLVAVWTVVYLGVRTRQRLAVRTDRIDIWLVTFGLAWRHRRLETELFQTFAYPTRRSGVEVRTPGGRIFVHMHGTASIRWLERQIVAAVKDARHQERSDRVPCPGCGGPVAEEKALRDAGGVECPHCGTGLVQTGGGIALPPAEVGHGFRCEDDPKAPKPRRDGAVHEWSAPPWARTYPKAAPLNLLALLALQAGLICGAWWVVMATPILRLITAAAALGMTVGILKMTLPSILSIYGAHTFRLGARYLEYAVRLGPWDCKRRRIPLSRLLSLDARMQFYELSGQQVVSQQVQITAKTATSEIEIEAFGFHLRPIVRDVMAAVPARIEALGREVVRVDRLRSEPGQSV